MAIDVIALLDPVAFTVVLAGTTLATIARCGFGNIGAAIKAVAKLVVPRFNEDANRAALARSAPEIRLRGHLSADPKPAPDRSLAALVDIFRMSGSIATLRKAAQADKILREEARIRAVGVFDFAAELAPVFGLVGTLFAITQLSGAAGEQGAVIVMGSVATAVLSSLYGVLTAHLICGPISGAIERRGVREEIARERLLTFFEGEVTGEKPPSSNAAYKRVQTSRTLRDAA